MTVAREVCTALTRRATPTGVRATRLASAALLAAAALSAVGCGGSSAPHGSQAEGVGPHGEATQEATGVRPPAATLPSEAKGVAADGTAAADVGATVRQRARHPRGAIDDEIAASAATLPNPCALVTKAQAQAIMQSATRAPVLAPQGPTCVYASRDSKQQVTISILSGPRAFAHRARLSDRMRVKVGGRHAYCGVAGGPTLRMALGRGRVIDVSAPCPIAAAFAADALSRLGATR